MTNTKLRVVRLQPHPTEPGAALFVPPSDMPLPDWWVPGTEVYITIETFGPDDIPVAVAIRPKDKVDRLDAALKDV